MRFLLFLALALAAPASAQLAVRPGEPLITSPLYRAPAVAAIPPTPASQYITPGQDEPGYALWVRADPQRPPQVAGFYGFLAQQGVAGIVPTWELLRTATDWQRCAGQPFEVPPSDEWPHLVETLKYIQAHVIPVVGPVEPVSVYRNPALNACAGGAPASAHQLLYAVDLVPARPTTREALIRGLCAIHLWQGAGYDVGLGFYKGLRFHVDSKKFRKWGGNGRGDSSPCAAAVAELSTGSPREAGTGGTDPLAAKK